MNDAPAQGQGSPLGNTVVGTSPQAPGTSQPTGQPVDQQQTPQEPVGQPLGQPVDEEETLRLSGSSQLTRGAQAFGSDAQARRGDEPALESLAVSSSGGKELEPAGSEQPEELEVREIEEPEAVPEEVQGWVERVERGEQIHLAQPIVHQGEILVDSANPKNVKVILPLTEEATKLGLHRKVAESVRWLAEWCWRLFRKLPGRVLYQQPKGTI